MNHDSKSEIKKIKKVKEASQTESYEDENEAMENSPESSSVEEEELAGSYVPSPTFPTASDLSFSEAEPTEKGKVAESLTEKKQAILKEKWLSVTGRKPRNIPEVRRLLLDESQIDSFVFFGDRRPAQIEKERKRKWMRMITEEVFKKPVVNYGLTTRELRLYNSGEGLWTVRFQKNLEYMATGFRNGGVQVRKPLSGEIIVTLKSLESVDKLPVRTIKFHPNYLNKLYLGGACGIVQVMDVPNGSLAGTSENISQINNIDINASATALITVGRNGKIYIMDATTLQPITAKIRPALEGNTKSNIDDEYHRLRIYGLRCHPTEVNLFVTGGWDRNVKVWDIRAPGAILSINGPFVCSDGVDILENTILTASWVCEDSLQLWDFQTGKLIQTIPIKTKATKYDGEFLYPAQFFKEGFGGDPPSGQLIAAAGSGFNEAVVIKVPEGKVLASFPAYKCVSTLDTQAGYIAFGGKESLLRIGQVLLPKTY